MCSKGQRPVPSPIVCLFFCYKYVLSFLRKSSFFVISQSKAFQKQ
jgi:hypothetical protein